MKIFAINLAKDTHKKQHILNEGLKHNLKIQIHEATNGKMLSDEQINELVYDYPDCALTKGEIGCALSHLNIYKKIVDEAIPIALILEDDAVLSPELSQVLAKISSIDDQNANAYLLTQIVSYIDKPKATLHTGTIYPLYDAACTHGYIINQQGAKLLLESLLPIRFEADRWSHFRDIFKLNTYCLLPHIIDSNDIDLLNSSLEDDRKMNREQRRRYIYSLAKSYRKARWKKRLWKGFIKPFLKIVYLQ